MDPLKMAHKIISQRNSQTKLLEVQEGLQKDVLRLDLELDAARDALKTHKRQQEARALKSKEHLDDLRSQANLVPALREEVEVLRKRYPKAQIHKFFTQSGGHTESVPKHLRGRTNWISLLVDQNQTQITAISRAETEAKIAMQHANLQRKVGKCECPVCKLRRIFEAKIEEQAVSIRTLRESLNKELNKGKSSGKRGKDKKQRKDRR